MRIALLLPLLLAACAAIADAPSTPATKPAALSLALTSAKDTYPLPAAQSGKEFRDQLTAVRGRLPNPPAVDLTLKFTNNSPTPITLPFGGDDSTLRLKLDGPGALNLPNNIPMTREFRMGKPVTIAPGQSYDHQVTSLAGGARGISEYSYFTEPGEYTLTAQFSYDNNGARATLTSPPLKFKVTAP